MRGRYDEIRALGAEVVAIGTGNVRHARSFIKGEKIPFPVLVDDHAEAAKAASIRRVGFLKLFAPASFPGSRRAWRAGHRVGMPGKRTNQLGATFVVGPGSAVRYAHYDAHTADHAPMDEVFDALRGSGSGDSETRGAFAMGKYSREELESAYQQYWRMGAVGEDWDAWADLFTEDATYYERILGTMQGREAIRKWIKPIMEQYAELYTAYEWHLIDEENGRVVFYMQNRRDHPSGEGTIDFPGVSILEYAGDGKWKLEEDYWAVRLSRETLRQYAEACEQFDPGHPRKRTRLNWGNGPEWTRGAPSYALRKPVR